MGMVRLDQAIQQRLTVNGVHQRLADIGIVQRRHALVQPERLEGLAVGGYRPNARMPKGLQHPNIVERLGEARSDAAAVERVGLLLGL